MLKKMRAIIIGGGPAGLATALRLQQKASISCIIYELRPEPTTLGGAIGILPNGTRLLDRLGLYEDLKVRGSSHSKVVMQSMRGGTLGEMDITRSASEQVGTGYMRIKRTDLQEVMLGAVSKARIPIHYNKNLTFIKDKPNAVEVGFSDGTTDTADLLLGCDGIHSAVRRLHVDPGHVPQYTGMAGLGALIPASALPPSISSQIRGMNVTLTQEGMFAAMSCTASDDEVFWGFSKELPLPESGDTRDGWEVQRKEEVDDFKASLLNLFKDARGNWGNVMRQVVDKTSAVKLFPTYRLPRGGTWHKGRCILLGDAAHAMPPHAGQGVSMALEDGFLLARLLEDRSRAIEDALNKYNEVRRPRVEEIAQRAGDNASIRRKTGPLGLWFKEMGMWMFLRGSWAFGTDRWGSETRQIVYDIDKAVI